MSFRTAALSLIVIFMAGQSVRAAGHPSASPELKSLAQQAKHIQGIELLIADATDDGIASRFGHSMLRFVMNGNEAFKDPVVGFIAKVDDERLSLRKGMFGGYDAFFEIHSLSEFYRAYINEQNRPIRRYILPTNPALRENLINLLLKWAEHPESLGNYWFVGKNCTDLLLSFLSLSGIPVSNPPIAIPTNIGEVLVNSLITPFPPIDTYSPKEFREKINQGQALSTMRTELLQAILGSLNGGGEMDLQTAVFEELKTRTDRKPLQEVYNLSAIPFELYQLCVGACNYARFKAEVLRVFNSIEIDRLFDNAIAYHRVWQRGRFRKAGANSAKFENHFRTVQTIFCDQYRERTSHFRVPCAHSSKN